MKTGDGQTSSGPPLRVIGLGVLIVASVTLCIVALANGWVQRDTIQAVVEDAGPYALVAYVVAVIILELLWFPRMWGLFCGGLLFGPLWGGALSLVADLLGALLCYLLARGAGQAWVQKRLEAHPRAQRIVALLALRRGTSTIAVLRVCPVAHYTLVSYAAGLSGVRPRNFLLGTLIGIIPGAVLYPLVGDSILEPGSPTFLTSVGILVVFLVVTTVAARRVLGKEQAEEIG